MSILRAPVYVIDTSVISYNIMDRLSRIVDLAQGRNTGIVDYYLDVAIRWINCLGFLTKRPEAAILLWVGDSKPYWRKRYFPAYKDKRTLPSEAQLYIVSRLVEMTQTLTFREFEADDIAALVTQIFHKHRERFTTLNLVTVDTDWMGLVGKGVTWIDTGGYEPRVRGVVEAEAWMYKKLSHKSMLGKYTPPTPFQASDIWQYKIATGDKSDNLPAHCEPFLIDLMHPHPNYVLWERPDALLATKAAMCTVRYLEDPLSLELQMSKLGTDFPIRIVDNSHSEYYDREVG